MFLLQSRLLAQEKTAIYLEFSCNTHRAERHSSWLKIYLQRTPQHLVVRNYPSKSTDRKISLPVLMRKEAWELKETYSQPQTVGLIAGAGSPAIPLPLHWPFCPSCSQANHRANLQLRIQLSGLHCCSLLYWQKPYLISLFLLEPVFNYTLIHTRSFPLSPSPPSSTLPLIILI